MNKYCHNSLVTVFALIQFFIGLQKLSAQSRIAAPVVSSPINGSVLSSTTTSATFSWAPVTGASGYLVRVDNLTDKTMRDPRNTYNGTGIYLYIDNYKSTSISVPVKLGHSYNFWVHSITPNFRYSALRTWSTKSRVSASVGTVITPPPQCIGSTSQSCSIANGSGSQSRTCNNGVFSAFSSCQVASCNSGYQVSANSCVAIAPLTCAGPTSQSCTIANGAGAQSRTCTNGNFSAFSSCQLSSCNSGYQVSNNSCVAIAPLACAGPTSQSCTIANGAGTQSRTCNTTTGVYGNYSTCAAIACSAGYQLSNNVCLAIINTPPAPSGYCRSITQHEITWTFNDDYPCGKFANGDSWVTPIAGGNGRVRINSISPNVTTSNSITMNGWAVNPSVGWRQPYDTRAEPMYFDASPTLPYDASPNQSIIKAKSVDISASTNNYKNQMVKTASILTILSAVPANNGANFFRPPYVSGPKPLISVPSANVVAGLLPTDFAVGSLSGVPSLSGIRDTFSKPFLVYVQGQGGSNIAPADFTQGYGPDKTRAINNAILRLLLNDSVTAEKLSAITSVLQQGIDQYHVFKNNGNKTIYSQGGTQPFYRALLAFTATLLGDAAMKTDLLNANESKGDFAEDYAIYSGVNGFALFGTPNSFDGQYWFSYVNYSQSKTNRDPYGYIDGGQGGGDYFNIIEPGTKGAALIAIMMPAMSGAWNNKELNEVIAFEKRYTTQGLHYLPDPCATYDGVWTDKNGDGYANIENDSRNELTGYGVKYGPSSAGGCIKGNGRQTSRNGQTVKDGAYSSGLVNQMWNKFVP